MKTALGFILLSVFIARTAAAAIVDLPGTYEEGSTPSLHLKGFYSELNQAVTPASLTWQIDRPAVSPTEPAVSLVAPTTITPPGPDFRIPFPVESTQVVRKGFTVEKHVISLLWTWTGPLVCTAGNHKGLLCESNGDCPSSVCAARQGQHTMQIRFAVERHPHSFP